MCEGMRCEGAEDDVLVEAMTVILPLDYTEITGMTGRGNLGCRNTQGAG